MHWCEDCGDPCDCGGFDEATCMGCAYCNMTEEDRDELDADAEADEAE